MRGLNKNNCPVNCKNLGTVIIVDACKVYVSDTFKRFTFNSHNNVIGQYYYQFHFKDEKNKAQG